MAKIRDLRRKDKFSIDDRYLNGYAKLCKWNGSLAYMSLCRHADKQQKCFPSINKIAEQHGVGVKSVQRGIENLEKWGVIQVIRKKNNQGKWKNNEYILLDKSGWKSKPQVCETRGIHRSVRPKPQVSQAKNHRSVRPHKDTQSKDTQLRSSKNEFCGADINSLIDLFKPLNPFSKDLFANKTEREALESIVEVNGVEATRKLIEKLPALTQIKGCPQISRPYELKKKLGNLKQFVEQQKAKKKPYFRGNVMSQDLTRVLVNGEWKKFAGDKKEIKYK